MSIVTTIAPMRPEQYPLFLAHPVANYAADNVAVGRWGAKALYTALGFEVTSFVMGKPI